MRIQRAERISAALSMMRVRSKNIVGALRGFVICQIRTVIGLVPFNETPAIDIDHLTPSAILTAKHIIAANPLPKRITDLPSPGHLLIIKTGDETM